MNGNISETGIREDLEWFHRIGIGGVQNFDGAFLDEGGVVVPPSSPEPLTYMKAGWRQAFRHSVQLADQLGLEFSIASSPGWSETGGPWVKPSEAMKKLVWTETFIPGSAPYEGVLAKPSNVSGPFQNIPMRSPSTGQRGTQVPRFYADIATIAYRLPASEVPTASLNAKITSSAGGAINAHKLSDGDLAHAVLLPFENQPKAWIQFDFRKRQKIRAATLSLLRTEVWDADVPATLEASDDGHSFRLVSVLTRVHRPDRLEFSASQQTTSFPPVTARYFRVVFDRPSSSGLSTLKDEARAAHRITELILHEAPRVNRFEDKAGFASRQLNDDDATPQVDAAESLDRRSFINLTSRLRANGSLNWTPPAGRWVVLRFGYSLTGQTNSPASPAGTGFEVDKLNGSHVKRYLNAYLAAFEKTLPPRLFGRRGLTSMVTDSYEAGFQNWTDNMLERFRRLRGYDALPWLPVLAGRVVESSAASDRFSWDFRKTLADLIAEEHYGQISRSLHARGLERYGESHEVGRVFIGDGMEVKKTADIPMGAMWAGSNGETTQESADADILESASVSHIYGKRFVASESFTAYGYNKDHPAYSFAPEDLKPYADRMMSLGVNRFAIHTSVHQPDDRLGPGLGLGPFGQWFSRKETWANKASAWIEYLARSSYLLQQGQFVADIAYLYGDDTNLTSLFQNIAPPIPEGYAFDFVNSDALLHEMSVRGGRLVARSGMEYRVLVLDPSTHHMSLAVLRKIRELVKGGATVVGAPPVDSPSLADNEMEFRSLISEIWKHDAPYSVLGEQDVHLGQQITERLRMLRIEPDFSLAAADATRIRFIHRSLGVEGELYFVCNVDSTPRDINVSFRVTNKAPELWHADTAMISPVSYRVQDGRTVVPLSLEGHGAVFVLFRKSTVVNVLNVKPAVLVPLQTLAEPWEVSFEKGHGAPSTAHFDRLISWTESDDPGIQFFSGTATYSREIDVKPEWLIEPARLNIDLGLVKNIAEVFVNGRSVGIAWKAPFSLDLTHAAHVGLNQLDIKITNLWPNRLIGDRQPGQAKMAFAGFDPFEERSPLLPSGLLGPVVLFESQ